MREVINNLKKIWSIFTHNTHVHVDSIYLYFKVYNNSYYNVITV